MYVFKTKVLNRIIVKVKMHQNTRGEIEGV